MSDGFDRNIREIKESGTPLSTPESSQDSSIVHKMEKGPNSLDVGPYPLNTVIP